MTRNKWENCSVVLSSLSFSLAYFIPTFFSGARARQQLLTVFALSNNYQPADVSLAVTLHLPVTLYSMCCEGLVAVHPSSYQTSSLSGTSQLPVILQVACNRLLQIIAVSVG